MPSIDCAELLRQTGSIGQGDGPKLADEGELCRRGRRPEHLDAPVLQELNEKAAHPTRSGVNQRTLSRSERRGGMAQAVSGEALDR